MKIARFLRAIALLFVVGTSLASLVEAQSSGPANPTPLPSSAVGSSLHGVVVDSYGPVEGAAVRIHTTEQRVLSAADGSFVFIGLDPTQQITVTAALPGFYIGWETGFPDDSPLTITIEAPYTTDNHAYEWFKQDGVEGSAACKLCHTNHEEWAADAHSQSAVNPRFLSMYQGTDVFGNRSPDPIKNNLGVPQPPDLSQPYYGPGFMLDFPGRAGNCATCHTPMAGKIPNKQNCGWSGCHKDSTAINSSGMIDMGVSPLALTGDAAEGISCEFCHKIGEVYINRRTGLPYEDSPGILSVRLYRPHDNEELFFGSLEDVVIADKKITRDSYLPLFSESTFCAPCHHGVMGGVVGARQVTGGVLIYSSYSEWLASAYSDPETGLTCQECHMGPVDYDHIVFPEKGGPRRDSDQIHNHRMAGSYDDEFVKDAVSMTTDVRSVAGRIWVSVDVTNHGAGHDIPTDSPLRSMMLVVEATDSAGNPLQWRNGPLLPAWAGDTAGQPGYIFAKVLRDQWSGEMPTGAYWRPVEIAQDTRLPANATKTNNFSFVPPVDGSSNIRVRLIYRRVWPDINQWKSWNDSDVLMKESTLTYP